MSIPDFQTFMLPLLSLSAEHEWRISDAVERLSNDFQISADERALLLPSGRQTTVRNRIAWAKSYLIKAGLLLPTTRGCFVISDEGRKVLEKPPERVTIQYLSQFPGFLEFRERSNDAESTYDANQSSTETPSLTPDETIRQAHTELETELGGELLKRIREASPSFFESLVVRLLLSMGYGGSAAELSKALVGGTGDGGVDGVIDQDVLGLDRIYVQAKRYSEGNTVGSKPIREFFGSLDRFKASKGLFVTASTFTPSARETAAMLSKRIVLIDGTQLARLMIRHNVGCRVEETVEIKKLDEEFFE